MIPLNLTTLREDSGLSKGELARRLAAIDPDGNWDTTKVTRYESAQDSVPVGALLLMLRVLGLDRVPVPAPPPPGCDVGEPLADVEAELTRVIDAAEAAERELGEDAASIAAALRHARQRPLVELQGKFDAGKSTVINTLLGSRSLPTKFQPQTYNVTYVRHIDEKPAELEHAEAIILNENFDHARWHDAAHLLECEIARGPLGILEREDDGELSHGAALAFIDAPILKAITLVDTPGFGEDEAQYAVTSLTPDAVIFCDPIQGLMDSEALLKLTHILRRPAFDVDDPWERILILATHAHDGISEDEAEDARTGAAERVFRQTRAALIGEADDEPTWDGSTIRSRILPFHHESPARVGVFTSAFTSMAEAGGILATGHRTRADELVRLEASSRLAVLEPSLDEARNALDENLAPLPSKDEYYAQVDASLKEALAAIKKERAGSIRSCTKIGADYDAGLIQRLIESEYGKNRKEARQNGSAFIYGRITKLVGDELEPRVKRVTGLIEDLGDDLSADLPRFTAAGPTSTFNIKTRLLGAGAGAGVGAAGAGAAAAYAASFGNLGAYILVAKGVSVLSSLGISVGGTAAASTAVAAIGGPITIAVAAVTASALVGFSLAGVGNWHKPLAKAIHKRVVNQLLFSSDPKDPNSIPNQLKAFWATIEKQVEDMAAEAKRIYDEMAAARGHLSTDELKVMVKKYEAAIAWIHTNLNLNIHTTTKEA